MRSEFSANKALFETFQVAKKIASCVNSKAQSKLSDCSSLNDMSSMKEWQAKSGIVGKAVYVLD